MFINRADIRLPKEAPVNTESKSLFDPRSLSRSALRAKFLKAGEHVDSDHRSGHQSRSISGVYCAGHKGHRGAQRLFYVQTAVMYEYIYTYRAYNKQEIHSPKAPLKIKRRCGYHLNNVYKSGPASSSSCCILIREYTSTATS